ncbi:replication factor A protein 3 [Suhomyces tanzawaensis NRRL Y-17324]|uniref:Replication factor A protein 3 n=1 Tax=Suhomyces tanzawaensis NRRL Y-17324 TaxID=984487 RepID=A0A1E4SBM2_9ASCO|nr:replication factor A protein 3 [Suhomyces tanzawaensis NRRL Y-17324]ODV76914.1 replication factor A protein 3 [Suhomyces tanzawaensis NRRL Y-17324]
MDATNIRVDSTLLESHQGKIVRVIGKCDSYDASSDTATLISTGAVHLNLQSGEALEVNKNYEVIGKVSATSTNVSVYTVTPLSDNLNLENAQKLVHYTHKVPELYYDN